MGTAMRTKIEHLDSRERAEAKAKSRAADARALRTGRKSRAELKRKNEFLAPLVESARIDLSASRSLS